MLWWMVSTAKEDMPFIFQLDQLSFTHGPTSDNRSAAPEINPAREACLLQKSLLIIHVLPFHESFDKMSSPVWVEGCFNEHGSKQRGIHLGRQWKPREPECSKAMSELGCMATGLTADRISCALLSRKCLQKKTWLLVRSSSSPACVEIQRFQESMDSKQPGWVPGHMTGLLQVPGPQKAVFGLCQMSQHWSRWTESCIYLPLTDPTTVQPVWPQHCSRHFLEMSLKCQ